MLHIKEKHFDILYLLFLFQIITNIMSLSLLGNLIQTMGLILFVLLIRNKDRWEEKYDGQVLSLAVLLNIWNLVFWIKGTDARSENAVLLIGTVCGLYGLWKLRSSVYTLKLKDTISRHKYLIILLLIFVFLSIDTILWQPVWDSGVYYSFPYGTVDIVGIWRRMSYSIRNIYDLIIGGHAGYGFSLCMIIASIFGEGYESVHIMFIIVACISIICFYKTVGLVTKEILSDLDKAILTSLYAFSPYLLGIIGDINLDSFSTYFLVVFCYCSLKNYRILELLMGTLLCFTKESGIVYYGFFLTGKYLYVLFEDGIKMFWKKLCGILKDYNTYRYLFPIVFWGILLKMDPTGGWRNGDNAGISWDNNGYHCFGINAKNILAKTKQLLVLNFNWLIIVSIIVILILALLLKKRGTISFSWIEKKALLPVVFSYIGVVLFGYIYITCTHTRYLSPMLLGLCIVGGVLIYSVKKNLVKRIWVILISVLLLVQSFYTVDPVSRKMFPLTNVGNTRLITVRESGVFNFGDSIVYNRQFGNWRKLINQLLVEAEYDKNSVIIIPDSPNCTRPYILGDYMSVWNVDEKKAENYMEEEGKPDGENEILLKVDFSSADMSQYEGMKKIFIAPAWCADSVREEFLEKYIVSSQGRTSYKEFAVDWYLCY